MADRTVEMVLRICDMENSVVAVTLFKQLELYKELKKSFNELVDQLYTNSKLFDTFGGFPEGILRHFGFKGNEETVIAAINNFSISAATEEDWYQLKYILIEETLNRLCEE